MGLSGLQTFRRDAIELLTLSESFRRRNGELFWKRVALCRRIRLLAGANAQRFTLWFRTSRRAKLCGTLIRQNRHCLPVL